MKKIMNLTQEQAHELVYQALIKSGGKITQLSHDIGCSSHSVINWLKGDYTPRFDSIIKLARHAERADLLNGE